VIDKEGLADLVGRVHGRDGPTKVPKRGNYFHTGNPEGHLRFVGPSKATKRAESAQVYKLSYSGMLDGLGFAVERAATFRILET